MNNLFELVLVMCFKVIRMLFGGGEVNIVLVIVIESMFGFIQFQENMCKVDKNNFFMYEE